MVLSFIMGWMAIFYSISGCTARASKIEVASSSSPFSYSLRDHNRSANIKGYIHPQRIDNDSDSSWLPSQNNSKSDNDDSWLPTSTVTSESKSSHHHHRKGQNEVDDSWLPTTNDTTSKCRPNNSGSDNDVDYSWLPSTFTENQQKKHKNNNDKNKNKNTNTNTNKSKSKNNNSNINNNSNRNGGTQKKSGNDHWALAREVVFSCDHHIQNKELSNKTSDSSRKKDSPTKSRGTVESPTSGGVSSLLQRWRDLAEAKNSSKNGNVSPLSTRNNVGFGSCKENNSSEQSPPNTSKDSDADWETDKTGRPRRFSCPLPSRESQDIKDSNVVDAEKEKIRVVDIIKKLSREEELAASAASGNVNESLPPIRTSLDHRQMEGEQKHFKGVRVSRHLIRGRQAFNYFLMQMEHDKHHELKWLVERKAVSKFSHRGRIQALLRFRILRLGAEPKPEDKRHKRCISKTLDPSNRLDIMNLRERFNSGVEKGAAETRKDKRNLIKNTTTNEETYSTPTAAKEVDFKTKTKPKTTSTNNINSKKEEPRSKQEPMTPNQSTSSCKDVVHKAKDVNSSSKYPIIRKEEARYKDNDKYEFHEDEGQFMSAKTSYSHIEDKGMISDSEETDYTDKKQGLESFEDWMTSEYSQTRSDLDEDESYDMQLFDSTYDWISDISRPKSDWEDMRQARYQEMLNHSSGNADIRRLLERKSVSSFLSSGLRELIDQLMMSRIQQSHVQVEKQEVDTEKDEPRKEGIEQEDDLMVDEFGDCRSTNDNEKGSDYCETPYSERSWRPQDGVYSSETTTTTTTTTTSPSLDRSLSTSNRSHNNSTPQSSSGVTHHSIEMELVYDLRGHMEQLHQEIMELRKSMKCCVNMQLKMQRTFKQHVAIAPATHPVQKKEKKPLDAGKNDCFICSDKQVDSLLYRCGHMCTCFMCAVELQRTSGECPVCEAPIVDVVRAFAHEN